jgi:hypothetical protein
MPSTVLPSIVSRSVRGKVGAANGESAARALKARIYPLCDHAYHKCEALGSSGLDCNWALKHSPHPSSRKNIGH